MLKKKKIIYLLVLIILSLNIVSSYASSLDELKDDQKNLESEIENTKTQIGDIEARTKDVTRQIEDLDKKLNQATIDLENVEQELRDIEEQIVITTEELAEAERDLEEKRDTFNKRIRVMYMNGNSGYLELLLSSDDIKDFLSRQEMVESIAEHDRELIKFMKETRDTIDAKKVELEAQRASVEVTKSKIESRKRDLDQATREKQDLMGRLAIDKKALEEQIDKLNEEAKDLEVKILKLMRDSGPYSGGKMEWPAPGYYRITSEFGYRIHPILKVKKLHTGMDIGVPTGGDIVAAAAGTVIYSGSLGGYGNTVMLDHGGGIVTLYAHNSRLVVSEGQVVARGDVVAKAGSTGMSTGPHLHFEVRKNGAYQDPLTWLK
ncbi:MAG TPA: peptidoglycan DD-metalloendopeptidase family protein [Tissierellaceae bacterium]|nr:peptidoglycan DD-metalloendopeptidase family protein [Tissierellaceae bacterium]